MEHGIGARRAYQRSHSCWCCAAGLRAAGLCCHAVPERGADVPGRADGGQDGAAASRRFAGGVEHVPGVLPGGAASRLRLCPRTDASFVASGAGPGSCRRAVAGRGAGAAPRSWHQHAVAGRVTGAVAADPPGAGIRSPGVRHFGDRTPAAKLVRRCGPQGSRRSLFPVCREQRRQSPGVARISAVGRANDVARLAGDALVLRLWCPGAGHRAVRRRDCAPRSARCCRVAPRERRMPRPVCASV